MYTTPSASPGLTCGAKAHLGQQLGPRITLHIHPQLLHSLQSRRAGNPRNRRKCCCTVCAKSCCILGWAAGRGLGPAAPQQCRTAAPTQTLDPLPTNTSTHARTKAHLLRLPARLLIKLGSSPGNERALLRQAGGAGRAGRAAALVAGNGALHRCDGHLGAVGRHGRRHLVVLVLGGLLPQPAALLLCVTQRLVGGCARADRQGRRQVHATLLLPRGRGPFARQQAAEAHRAGNKPRAESCRLQEGMTGPAAGRLQQIQRRQRTREGRAAAGEPGRVHAARGTRRVCAAKARAGPLRRVRCRGGALCCGRIASSCMGGGCMGGRLQLQAGDPPLVGTLTVGHPLCHHLVANLAGREEAAGLG